MVANDSSDNIALIIIITFIIIKLTNHVCWVLPSHRICNLVIITAMMNIRGSMRCNNNINIHK